MGKIETAVATANINNTAIKYDGGTQSSFRFGEIGENLIGRVFKKSLPEFNEKIYNAITGD